ncbi:MAG: NACHT domain-containing protein [Anaerolineae bacterium]
MGYSARGLEVQDDVTGSVIVTAADREAFVADDGVLAWLFNQLPDHEHVLARYRADLRRAYMHHPLRGLTMPRVEGAFLDPATVQVPMERSLVRLRPLATNSHPPGAPIPPREAVARHTRLIILGQTGSGKSTLLHHLAWADVAGPGPLPLLIPLRQVDRPLKGKDGLLEAALDYLTASKDRVERQRVRRAMEQEIAAGRVRWLWDGLDQVQRHRSAVLDALAELADEGYPLVITSHPHGYKPIAGCENVYEIASLTSDEIASFAHRWFFAFAAAQERPEQERESWVTDRLEWFQRQLKARPELWAAAEIPLALTFLIVLAADEPRQELPSQRKDLYDRTARRALAMTRNVSRATDLAEGTGEADLSDNGALSGLHRAALYLHRMQHADPEETTYSTVLKALADEEGQGMGLLRRFQSSTRVRAAIRFWEEAGILDRYRLAGEEHLAFRHSLLREYGAARALAARHEEDLEELWTELSPCVPDPRWSDVIPLTLAYLGDATPLLQHLAQAEGSDSAPHPLRLAAWGLIEGACGTDDARQTVLDGLEHLASTSSSEATRSGALTDLLGLGRLGESYAIQRLLSLASRDQVDDATRSKAAQALDELECTDELLALSRDSQADPVIRRGAAQALQHLGRTQELAQAWDVMARDHQVDSILRVELAQNLSDLDQVEVGAEILLDLARDDQVDLEARQQAARALARLDRPGEAVEAWLALALDDVASGELRQEAAEALEHMSQDEAAAQAWLAIAGDEDAGQSSRRAAAEALASLGEVDAAAETWLALALEEHATLEMRREAADALTALGQSAKVGRVWLALAQDERMAPRARKEAAYNLIYSDHVEAAVDVLLDLVRDARVDFEMRKEAGEALGHLGRTEDAAEAWLALANDEAVSGKTRLEAIGMLQQLGRGSDTVEAVLDIAQDREVNQWTRVEASKVVAQMGLTEEAADLFLILANEDGLAWWVREGAIRSMSQLGKTAATPERLASLQQIATDSEVANEVRKAAQRALQRLRAPRR